MANLMITTTTTTVSGAPNTGQVQYTQGGSRTYSSYSGTAGGDALIQSGAVRLDWVALWPPATAAVGPAASGLPFTFYDAAVAVSGGPLSTSGHKAVKISPVCDNLANSIIFNSGLGLMGRVVPMGVVFTSGLCFSSMSGQAGFTISYSPVASN